MDSEHRRPVAALSHGDERDGWGAGARKGKSDDLPDTTAPLHYSSLLPSNGDLAFAYVDFILSSNVVQHGKTDSLGRIVGNRGPHEPKAGI